MTPEQLKAEIIFNKHSWKELGAISPSKRFCVPAMLEYASIVSAEKDKEIAELCKCLDEWKQIAKDLQFALNKSDKELAAAKERIVALEKEVENAKERISEMDGKLRKAYDDGYNAGAFGLESQ